MYDYAMDDCAETNSLLSNLEPGKLPLEIFNQVARLTVTPVVEIVPFFKNGQGDYKVFLMQRGADDALWANQYHVPGAIVLATDTPGSFSDAINRIVTTKLASYSPGEISYVDVQLCHVSRGAEVAIIFSVELATSPDSSLLFDPMALPNDMIEGQAEFVYAALRNSRKN